MTNKFKLGSFLFLLAVSSLVSGRRLLAVEERDLQNTTVSNSTSQYNNGTDLQPTGGPPQITGIREPVSSAPVQNASETTPSQPSQGNGTDGHLGTETSSTTHQWKGNESSAGTESPPQTPFPDRNGSSDPMFSTSVGPRNGANATNVVPTVVTTLHKGTDLMNTTTPRSRTTLKPMLSSTREIRTTQNPVPTKPHSTQKSTTKACPTTEPKTEGLVGTCLIAIASLAALAIIFIMTTIILATKLAGSRYRHRASLLHDTEMVCISALLNDSDHPIPTPKRPKSNGALIPITEDEDGDDLTLNSFLHDTEGVA